MNLDLHVTLLHELPGRMRMRLSAPPAECQRFNQAIMSHDGLDTLQFNELSKSLLVTYASGHLTTEEIVLRVAIALSMEYDYKPVQVHLGGNAEVMTDGAIIAGFLLAAAGGVQLFSRAATGAWLTRAAGAAVALAVGEHGWREARQHGYVHPELLSVGYLAASWFRGNPLRGATVTWVASFGRHLLHGPEKCIDVRPINKYYEKNEPRTYQISLVPQHQRFPLLRWAHSTLGIFGLSGFGSTVDSLYKEIHHMAQAHDRVMEGLDLQSHGIPLTFRKEIVYEHQG
ncbi:MAG: hypothetical protein N839_0010595 [Desulfofustis sp. PB-SRB1]|jgi:hypothetical protein|nr:hypothetical protein [Desulfofustis sp. PB-SRB1]MBM1002849.1 hypothetical protein [Desulfofustis sp. PB-SRB1]HBH28952.1 hypothetical protein [Desulfofustis sp.]